MHPPQRRPTTRARSVVRAGIAVLAGAIAATVLSATAHLMAPRITRYRRGSCTRRAPLSNS
jgi:hypothetical protein